MWLPLPQELLKVSRKCRKPMFSFPVAISQCFPLWSPIRRKLHIRIEPSSQITSVPAASHLLAQIASSPWNFLHFAIVAAISRSLWLAVNYSVRHSLISRSFFHYRKTFKEVLFIGFSSNALVPIFFDLIAWLKSLMPFHEWLWQPIHLHWIDAIIFIHQSFFQMLIDLILDFLGFSPRRSSYLVL